MSDSLLFPIFITSLFTLYDLKLYISSHSFIINKLAIVESFLNILYMLDGFNCTFSNKSSLLSFKKAFLFDFKNHSPFSSSITINGTNFLLPSSVFIMYFPDTFLGNT